MKYKYVLLIVLFFAITTSHGQRDLDSLYTRWENTKLPDSLRARALYKIAESQTNKLPDSAKILIRVLRDFTQSHNLKKDEIDTYLLEGNLYWVKARYAESLTMYQKALKMYEAAEDLKGKAAALQSIGRMYKSQWDFDTALKYYEEGLAIAEQINDEFIQCTILLNIGNVYADRFKHEIAAEYMQRALKLSQKINNKKEEAFASLNLALNRVHLEKKTEAMTLFNNALKIAKSSNDLHTEASIYSPLCLFYNREGDYKNLLKHATLGYDISETLQSKRLQRDFCYWLYMAHKNLNNTSKALYYFEKLDTLSDALQDKETLRKLEGIEYANQKKQDSLLQVEKDLKIQLAHGQELAQNEKEKRLLTLGGSIAFVVLLVGGYFIYRMQKRKQLLAEKAYQEEIINKEKVIKSNELATINAMIEGQEKERQRVASELHDNVGSSLTAAKMHFDYILENKDSNNNLSETYSKTRDLLEDAYKEVRAISHLKNSGVMAKNGLLPAIEKLSRNASGVHGLTIDVNYAGVNKRLENTLEISIFRIVQELVTNIVKHAQATEATVNLTQHDETLSLIIEDNGKGFDASKIEDSKDGIGLNTIETRVINLGGNVAVDSALGHGTSILIDIPA